MPLTLNDDSIPANARVWDFAMPRKSWLMLPLSSENWLIVGRSSIRRQSYTSLQFLAITAGDDQCFASDPMNFQLKFAEARRTTVRHPIICVVFVIHHSSFVMRWLTPPWWDRQD